MHWFRIVGPTKLGATVSSDRPASLLMECHAANLNFGEQNEGDGIGSVFRDEAEQSLGAPGALPRFLTDVSSNGSMVTV